MRALTYVVGVVTSASVAASLAACGTHVDITGPLHPVTSVSPAGGPQAQSKAAARALDKRMLALAPLPSGTKPLSAAVRPPALAAPERIGTAARTIDLARFYRAPVSMPSLGQFLQSHAPSSMVAMTTGTYAAAGRFVSYMIKTAPDGVAGNQLTISMLPAPGGSTYVRVDAEAVWALPRTAAEHVNPASYRAVVVTMHQLLPRAGMITRTFTAPSVIAELAGKLNAMPTSSGLPMSCPMFANSFRLTFEPKSSNGERIDVTTAPCDSVDVKAGGSPQPALVDSTGLASLIIRMVGAGQNHPGHHLG